MSEELFFRRSHGQIGRIEESCRRDLYVRRDLFVLWALQLCWLLLCCSRPLHRRVPTTSLTIRRVAVRGTASAMVIPVCKFATSLAILLGQRFGTTTSCSSAIGHHGLVKLVSITTFPRTSMRHVSVQTAGLGAAAGYITDRTSGSVPPGLLVAGVPRPAKRALLSWACVSPVREGSFAGWAGSCAPPPPGCCAATAPRSTRTPTWTASSCAGPVHASPAVMDCNSKPTLLSQRPTMSPRRWRWSR